MADLGLILLAADDALIVLWLEIALGEAGFDVRQVSTGALAIRALENASEQISGVVTDIRLEDDIDGWAVARHAREMKANIPIVYMSGGSAHEHPVLGVPDSIMIQKPFAAAQLITAISALLSNAKSQAPD